MATATKEKKKAAILDKPCEFGSISDSGLTSRIGVKISRERMRLDDIDVFVGHRLNCVLRIWNGTTDPAQMTFDDDSFLDSVEGQFDCKAISVSAKQFSLSLSVPSADLKIQKLVPFIGAGGRIKILQVTGITEDEK